MGTHAIVCMGEYIVAKDMDKANDVLGGQLNAIKKEVTDWSKISFAYEPLVWDSGRAKKLVGWEVGVRFSFIREWLSENVSHEVSQNIQLMWAGESTPQNAPDIMEQ